MLGVGLGWRAEEFEALGVRSGDRARRLEDSITAYRQAWSGQLVTGGEHLATRMCPSGRCLRGRAGSIWIGGHSERAIRRAGRLADGFMAGDVTPTTLASQVELARDALASAGREGSFTIAVHLPTFAWHGDDAWELVRRHHSYVAWKYDDMDDARHRAGDPRSRPRSMPSSRRISVSRSSWARPRMWPTTSRELEEAAGAISTSSLASTTRG